MSITRLQQLINDKNAPVCVGLDPRTSMFLEGETLSGFGARIIDSTSDLIPCVKPQSAFYESFGLTGIEALRDTIKHARNKGLYTILDAKRGDIGSTAAAYADAYLAHGAEFECDALTVSAYLGSDGIKPFLERAKSNDKALFALVKTSNASSCELQEAITSNGESVYVRIARILDSLGENNHLGFVIGATYPAQLSELREMFPNTFFLIPGYGAQGGTGKDIEGALNSNCEGFIVSNSRNITARADPRAATIEMIEDLKILYEGNLNSDN